MAEKPLLLFPSRSRISYEAPSGGFGGDLRTPNRIAQSGRINAMFKKVSEAFEEHKAVVNATADGLAPEMVLVFETRGPVHDFFKAVAKIPELKWLGEYEEEFPATEEFRFEDDPTKPISGKFYFVLANNASIRELRSLWGIWKSKKQRFKQGLNKWKHLFDLLYDIRPWGVKDRIEETGILIDWQYRMQQNQEFIPFEVELWYRKSPNQRIINRQRLLSLINDYSIEILKECVIPEIAYHGLLMKAPIKIFDALNDNTEIKFFQSSDIMQIRPVGQAILEIDNSTAPEITEEVIPELHEYSSPVIALLDGMPIQNHVYLANRLTIHDPDGFEENYPASKRIHCTGMASIIIHGDLNNHNAPLKTKLLVRPVMRYHPFDANNGEEYIPENYLLVDLIHRAVKEILEGSAASPAIAPTVKIVNLSIGDKYRVFANHISPWAKLIDWLSEKYNALFIVSAGNASDEITLNTGDGNFDQILSNSDNLLKSSINYLFLKNRFRKILSPAEAINALTVGASHEDIESDIKLNNRINLYTNPDLLSPISRMGLGFRKSIKPDILAKGGRMLFRNVGHGTLRTTDYLSVPPGIKVAAPADGLNGIRYTKGTSNATAIVSNLAGKIFETFLDDEALKQNLSTTFFAIVAKALIVHSASWNENVFNSIASSIPNITNKKELVSRFIGYGKIHPERILECTDKRVTLIGYGSLKPEEAFLYELPLPDGLSGVANWRKLIVTLAWFSPVNSENQLYRTHKLWFDFPGNDIDTKLKAKRAFYDDDAVRRGTVQHEIFESNKVQAFAENSKLNIKVNCKTDAVKYDPISFSKNKNVKAINYALIVTLEVDPMIQTDVYNYISLRVKQQIRQPL